MYIRPDVFVYKVPESIPKEVAVLAEPFTVTFALDEAIHSLSGNGFCGDTVVVQGVGPLGLCCLIKARILGAGEIVAIDLSDFRLKMAKEFSADFTLNAKKTERNERIDYIRELTGGRGADMVIGCTGVPDSFTEGLEMLRKSGIYIELGNFVDTGTISINVHRHVCAKNARIIGVTNHPFTKYGATLKLFLRYSEQFPFEKMVTHRYKLQEAFDALLKSREGDTMKVVIEP